SWQRSYLIMAMLSRLRPWLSPSPSPRHGRRSSTQPPLRVEELETRCLLATVGLTPGWATFGQVFPQGEMWESVQIDKLPTQTDVNTYWPDGSIRFAVLSAWVPQAGDYTLYPSDPAEGALKPDLPDADVQFNIGSTTYTAALPRSLDDFDRWLDGPVA